MRLASLTRRRPALPSLPLRGKSLDMLEGVQLLFEGLRLLRRDRRLWPLAAAPVLLAIAAVGATSALLYAYAGPLYGLLTAWLPRPEATAWYTWVWIGPAKVLLALAGAALFALAAALSVAIAFLAANAVAAPFLDVLSRRVEAIAAGAVIESDERGWRAVWNEGRIAVAGELQRLLFFAAVTLGLTAVGLLVPGGQLVAPPLLVAVTALFLPLQYAGYALDRRRLTFRQRRQWILSRWPMMGAFGGTAFLTFLVPGLNFVMIPALVVGGTLLVLRHPPAPFPPT